MGFSMRSPSITSLEYISQSRDLKVLVAKTSRGFDVKNKSRHFFGGKILSLYKEDVEASYAAQFQHMKSSAELGHVRTLLIDNYDSYTYNIYQELSVINGLAPVVIYNDTLSWEEIYHYINELRVFDNIVISPGPGTPTCEADIGICLRLLLECPGIPILGICLGHQALGYAHGARITHAPEPVHGRLSHIEHNNCELFFGIPSGTNSGFKVVRYHSLVVDPNSLPKELIPIAWTSSKMVPLLGTCNFDSHLNGHPFSSKTSFPMDDNLSGNVLMGIMHSSRPHYGLQFHPESVATSYGRQIFKNFADITRDYWFRRKSSSLKMELQHFVCNQMHNTPLFQDVAKYLVNKSINNGSLMSTLLSTKSNFLKLVWRKLKCTASQLGGAKHIFCELFNENRAANTFWLDSSSTEMNRARFSFMGGKGGPLWKQVTFRLSDRSCDKLATNRGGHLRIEDALGHSTSTYLEDGFLSFLNQEMQSFRYDAADYEALPFDFCGGYVGYIGYDLKVECGLSANRHKSRTPDACLFFADNLVVIDHHFDDVYLLSLLDAKMNLTPWLDDVEQKLMNMSLNFSIAPTPSASVVPSEYSSDEGFLAEKSRDQYIGDIGKCQKLIGDGESYELCLTMQMKRRVEEIDPLTLYLDLRSRNPAPYAAWLDFSKENLHICCSSPERFLRLDGDGILEAKPIKGTIGRGKSLEEDQLLKLQLQHSEKDQAENLMIVDLLRNDLGRVCEPGSVHVPHLMEVETYANIHTMVSTIRGKKQSNVTAVDCIQSAFPGGSMTGAPKLRSMEILDSLETSSRGVYSGCIGYLSYNQTFDLNIVIRTIVIHEDEASIGAGGAITALSVPEDEYEETMLKARAPSTAVMQILNHTDLKKKVNGASF